jgi:tRNA G18 (ribose-2'-O)-methylase SpoU
MNKQKREIVVILSNIRSAFNVGSIFRTADAVGCKQIYLCGITPAPVDRFGRPNTKIAKVSLGAENTVEWIKAPNLERVVPSEAKLNFKDTVDTIKDLKKEGYKIFAIEQGKNSISHNNLNLGVKPPSGKIALVLGEEVKGLPTSVLKYADKILEIPMFGKKESLNVSVAFGVVAYSLAQ